jgi:para-nitrobenzyl esterase
VILPLAGLILLFQSGNTVRVAGGRVAGVLVPSGIHEFRGIPFAAPPVGPLRWRAPQPVAPWTDVRDASRFGPRCMQARIFSDMEFRSPGVSEDCLTLNVWAPAPHGAKLPVLLYFYGGGYVAGDASEFRYDGEQMARRGIVVVTANYRLGVFGFFAHPGLTAESPHHASGNYGLLDQVAALQWVCDNIAAFGGDPSRITIAGESAGSVSVNALMVSPLSRNLIAGAIGESGALVRWFPASLREAENDGESFGQAVGAASTEALRAISAESLLAAHHRGGFRITVDGYFLPQRAESLFADGKQAHVPLLVGWNSEEASSETFFAGGAPTPENWAARLDLQYGPGSAQTIMRLLPRSDSNQVKASATLFATARFTGLNTWLWAQLASRAGGKPVYVYNYTHPRPGASGAVHSAEIEYALGNLSTNHVYTWTPDDSAVSDEMQAYFAAFIKTGVPNAPGLPSWPALQNGDSAEVMILDVHPHAGPVHFAKAFAFFDSIF